MVAPNFSLKDMHSEEVRSLEDYKGKALLLTFWVSWCPDCQRDLANKEQLYKSMNTNDLEMIMIHVSGRETNDGLGESYYKENNFSFPVVKDEGTKIYDAYQCMSVPTSFLLNKDHEIVGRFNDKASFQQMLKEIGEVI
ncbi:TlpA family protein disulfide reductase [Salipaludibacillus daqingensis]|uniref:TlpA family protein disulfide reductase n=1 Tax=Salipaludibacillus daqingensis TaxID=3041001 RepID=UPI002476662D|nr:TlpA disulfide reductase family protein [Salipaludibacillus daqingensis]